MAVPQFPWFSSDARARRRARELAVNDLEFLEELIRIRQDRGLKQIDVAEILGLTQQAISKFEQPGSDPRLSTIRQYSHAIGALVKHAAVEDDGQLERSSKWVEISFEPCVGSINTSNELRQVAVRLSRVDLSLAA